LWKSPSMHAIAIHGGAGLIRQDRYSEEEITNYKTALRDCLEKGYEVLEKNGSALDAVTAAVVIVALDQVFFFVPGSLGTFEGIRLTVLSTLGIAQAYGLAFGLMSRLENLFWNGLGLFAYALCTRTALFPQAGRSVASAPPVLPPTAP